MTDWTKLTEPFTDAQVKSRPGPGGRTLSYVDARDVAQRLDDVLTPEGWYFECDAVPGTEVVHGSLFVKAGTTWIVRQDHGYPNSHDDAEPIKAATSDALKRCAVLFGIGRHLYDDNHTGRGPSSPRPQAAPAGRPPRPAAPPTRAWDDSPLVSDKDILAPDDEDVVPFRPFPVAKPGDTCEEHGVEWRGEVGDLYHGPKPWHRHEGNTKRARR